MSPTDAIFSVPPCSFAGSVDAEVPPEPQAVSDTDTASVVSRAAIRRPVVYFIILLRCEIWLCSFGAAGMGDDVDDEGGDDEDHGTEQGAADHDRCVAGLGCAHRKPAYPVEAEDLLGDDRATED